MQIERGGRDAAGSEELDISQVSWQVLWEGSQGIRNMHGSRPPEARNIRPWRQNRIQCLNGEICRPFRV